MPNSISHPDALRAETVGVAGKQPVRLFVALENVLMQMKDGGMPNAGRAQTATTALRPQKAGFAFSLRYMYLMIDEESFEQGIVVLPYLVG